MLPAKLVHMELFLCSRVFRLLRVERRLRPVGQLLIPRRNHPTPLSNKVIAIILTRTGKIQSVIAIVYLFTPIQVRSATVQHRRHGGVNGGGKGRGQGLWSPEAMRAQRAPLR